MKDEDLDRKAKKRESRKDDERKEEEEELADSPSSPAIRSSRRTAAIIDDFDQPFTAANRDQTENRPVASKSKILALAPPPSAATDRSSARPSSEDRVPRNKKLAIAPAIPLGALRETDYAQDDESDNSNMQGQMISVSEVAGMDVEEAASPETVLQSVGVAPNVSPPDSRSQDDLEQDMSVIDASVAPISGTASPEVGALEGELFEEPLLAGAVVEHCGMDRWKRNTLIIVALIVIIGLVVGLVFGLNGNGGRSRQILVTSSPSSSLAPSFSPMQIPSAAPTDSPAPSQSPYPSQSPAPPTALSPIPANWTQFGQDLVGEANGDSFGESIAMSADGNIVAVGAPRNDYNDTSIDSVRGSVHVYVWNETSWSLLGDVLRGENAGDWFGESVALSADGTVLAVGAPHDTGVGLLPGYVRIFRLENDNIWSQVGSNLNGENAGDEFGFSVALSADGNMLAAGAFLNDDNGEDSGQVRIFRLVNDDWAQVGSNLNGKNAFDEFGRSVALSAANGTVLLAVGGSSAINDNEVRSGQVRVFRLVNDDDWSQVGSDLNGENQDDYFGISVALSADGTVLASGAPYNDDNGEDSGQVRISQLVNDDWSQVGSTLNGENEYDWFGYSVALSADGTVLAVGAYGNSSDNGFYSGHVRIFRLVNDDWAQVGSAINGKGDYDYFGTSVALSADGKTMAGGADQLIKDGENPGYAMIHHVEGEDE